MALNVDQLNTDSRLFYDKTLYDQIHDRIPLIHKLRKRKQVVTGGTKIQVGLKYARNTQSQHYKMGQTLNSGNDTKRTAAKFEWKYKNTPLKYTGEDEIVNNGDAEIFNTVTEEITAGQEDCMEYMSDLLYATTPGTDTSANYQGLLSAIDLTSTYGEITRSSTVNSWWRGTVKIDAVSASLHEFRDGYQTVAQYNGSSFKDIMCFTTKEIFQKFQALLQPMTDVKVSTDGEMAKAGFRALSVDGIEIVIDDNVPSGYFFMLDIKTWIWRISPKRDFKLTPFKWQGDNNNGTDEYLARILLAHNLVCNKPRVNRVWTNMS